MDRFTPPPIKDKGKKTPIKSKVKTHFQAKSGIHDKTLSFISASGCKI